MDTIPVDLATISAYGPARATIAGAPLSAEELRATVQYWRASLYMSGAMIYLRDNPLLRDKLKPDHVKRRLLGHWGADPGLSLVYVHLNRLIRKYDLDTIYLAGPGHGAPGVLSNRLSGGHVQRGLPRDQRRRGRPAPLLRPLLLPRRHRQPLHAGDARLDPRRRRARLFLSHAYGAAFDNPGPDRGGGRRRRRVGDRAAGDRVAFNKFLNPIRDGAVLPILHLNGYKINNPTILARMPHDEIEAFFRGYGWTPYFVEGSDPRHHAPGDGRDAGHCVAEIRRDPGGGPRQRHGRAPALADDRPAHAQGLDQPDRGRRPQARRKLAGASGADGRCQERSRAAEAARRVDAELQAGRVVRRRTAAATRTLQALAPPGEPADRLESARQWRAAAKAARACRTSATMASRSKSPATARPRTPPALGEFLRDVMRRNMQNFRVFGPDENTSNKLDAIYEAIGKKLWLDEYFPEDADGTELAPRRPRHGNAQRAHAGRHAGRLPAHRPARLLHHLRGVRPRHRFDVQPARQVADDLQRISPGGPRSPRSTC